MNQWAAFNLMDPLKKDLEYGPLVLLAADFDIASASLFYATFASKVKS